MRIAEPERSRTAADSDRLYGDAATLSCFGAWECRLEDERLGWTAGVYDLFGLPRGSRLARADTLALYEPGARARLAQLRAAAIREGQGFTLDAEIRTPAGTRRWMRLTTGVERRDGRPVRLFGLKQDITQDHQRWEALRRRAERDPLTGLASRALFQERFLDTRTPRFAEAGVGALLLVDLDHFKAINDRHGHPAGDECLRHIGRRLARLFPEALLVARIGGDEFALLLPAPLDAGRLWRRIEAVGRLLHQPVHWEDRRIAIGTSIGGALAARAGRDEARTLYAQADAALYAAKASGRGQARLHGVETQRQRIADSIARAARHA